MPRYADDPAWADIDPLPTDDGGPNPLAAIAYSADYAEIMSYLRALMAKNEMSERALELTEDLIDMNPAHYTVWLYRAQILFALDVDLREEIAWLNETALQHQKNYQIWHHRNLVVDRLGSAEGEADFINQMFELDAKNYHVWSYRQWLVKRFGLWEDGELEYTEELLKKDVRNNSAWNHRWFVINGKEGAKGMKDERIRDREIAFAKKAIARAPQNQSPWNYLRGIIRVGKVPVGTFKEFADDYASLEHPDSVRSSHALDLLAEIYGEQADESARASQALDLLAKQYDPIRKNYWEYRKGLLAQPSAAA